MPWLLQYFHCYSDQGPVGSAVQTGSPSLTWWSSLPPSPRYEDHTPANIDLNYGQESWEWELFLLIVMTWEYWEYWECEALTCIILVCSRFMECLSQVGPHIGRVNSIFARSWSVVLSPQNIWSIAPAFWLSYYLWTMTDLIIIYIMVTLLIKREISPGGWITALRASPVSPPLG